MPKVLPEYLELRRQQILDAAAACFSRRGFHLTTMQDICQEAELSPGAVYRYFPSKEAIIEGMCDRGQAQNAEALQEGLGTEATLDAFNELIRIFFLELENLRSMEFCCLNVELIAESPRNPRVRELQAGINADIRAQLMPFIAAAQQRGEIDPSLSPEAVVRVMVALYQGFITQKLVQPDLDTAGYAAVLKALFAGTFWLGDQQAPAAEPSPESTAALRH